ncbi:ABC transporter ATP-binding protein [Dongia rigui]|uniref:ABC transporter ATP-binding protein n=1 Tax=Dongia rigui TaxID=940149 RepID=A0ABU5DYR3_9PROT|nr:ABC transporter ATP-binding protein [Dongia rigui]MDY0872060.1 ABC transporter ATP-binding protein [Dongia rigui]
MNAQNPHAPVAADLGSAAPVVEISQVSKTFALKGKSVAALTGIDLAVNQGEFIAIVGASGCGKSTLLRLILGLDSPTSGVIQVDGRRVTGPSLDRGIVFQEHRLLPWLTVTGNVAVALRRSGLSKAAAQATIDAHLALVGLTDFAEAYPAQLSGGMQQRVAIARALANRPRLLLLDEPLGALDALTRLRLQDEIRRIVRQEGITAILVTHDVDEAVYLGDRIVVMEPHPGRIRDILPVDLGAVRDRSDPRFISLRDRVLAELGVTPAAAA